MEVLEAGPSRVALGADHAVPTGRNEALDPAVQARRRDHERHYPRRPEEREKEHRAGRPPAPPPHHPHNAGHRRVGVGVSLTDK